jgi:hypothetical protein
MSVVPFPFNRFTPRDVAKITASFYRLIDEGVGHSWMRSSRQDGGDMMCLMHSDEISISVICKLNDGSYILFDASDQPAVKSRYVEPVVNALVQKTRLKQHSDAFVR